LAIVVTFIYTVDYKDIKSISRSDASMYNMILRIQWLVVASEPKDVAQCATLEKLTC